MTNEWRQLKEDFQLKVDENEQLRQQLQAGSADSSDERVRELEEEVARLRSENAQLHDEIQKLKDSKDVERQQAEAIMKVHMYPGRHTTGLEVNFCIS